MPDRLDAQSIPGLEAVHTWAGVLEIGRNSGSLPRLFVDTIGGLHDLPDFDDEREPARNRPREQVYPSLSRGKTLTYSGSVQAEHLDELRYHAGLARAALLPDPLSLPEGVMRIAPLPEYGGHAYRYKARVRSWQCDDKQAVEPWAMPSQYQRAFSLVVRMSDGRFFVDDDPQVLQGADGAGNDDPFVDVPNPGTAPADPVIRITGPTVGPVISRPGFFLQIGNLNLAAGHYVDVDFDARTAIDDAGVDHADLVTATSTWWDTAVGLPAADPLGVATVTRVTLSQGAGHPGAGSSVRVTFDPAVW